MDREGKNIKRTFSREEEAISTSRHKYRANDGSIVLSILDTVEW